MDRRRFIRLVGGGSVAAFGAGLGTGCSGDYPSSAVAAWQGPEPDIELRHWALAHAILAPSAYNRQPWIVDLRQPDVVTLYVDRDRMLPETDPWSRQIIVSQGTFVELLVIALRERGIEPKVTLFPEGEFPPHRVDDRPVARLSLAAGATRAGKDALYAQILARQTAKVGYDKSRPIDPNVLAELSTASPPDGSFGLRFNGSVDPARIAPLRQICVDATRIELETPRTAMESLKLTRIGPSEIAANRDGISLNGPLVRLYAALGLFDRSKPPAGPGSRTFRRMMASFEDQAESAMGFVWLSTATAANAAAGRMRSAEVTAGRAYARMQLKATKLGLKMHPMSQALEEFSEMRKARERLHAFTVGRPAAEETVQMFCRIGYCDQQPHTPRRGVEAIVGT